MSEPARILHLVDEDGQATPQCPGCVDLERDLRAKRRRITILERELELERQRQQQDDPVRKDVERLFDLWRVHCNHSKSALDTERFKRLSWGLREYGDAGCARAIIGYGAFPYVTDAGRAATGTSKQRHDDIELIFRNAKQLEQGWKYADRAEEEALQAEDAA